MGLGDLFRGKKSSLGDPDLDRQVEEIEAEEQRRRASDQQAEERKRQAQQEWEVEAERQKQEAQKLLEQEALSNTIVKLPKSGASHWSINSGLKFWG